MIVPQRIGVEGPAGVHVWKEPLLRGISALFLPPQQQSQNVGIKCNLILGIGPVASTAIPELETALTDSDADVRTSAVLSLASLRSLEGLKTALAVADPQVRRIAIQSLGGKSSGEMISANVYEDMVNDPELSELGRRDFRRRYPPPSVAAQRGYGAAAIPLLIGTLDDTDEGNVTAAAYALANLGRTALPALQALQDSALHAPLRDTRVEALHALREIGPEGLPAISEALDDTDPSVRDYALKLLASYNGAGVPDSAAEHRAR